MIFIASRGILLRQLRPLLLLCLLCHLHDVLLHQFCLQLERCFAFHLNNSNGSVGMWLDPGMGQRRHPHIARTSSINGSTTIAAVEPITHAQSFALPTTWCKQRTRARSDCHSETGDALCRRSRGPYRGCMPDNGLHCRILVRLLELIQHTLAIDNRVA